MLRNGENMVGTVEDCGKGGGGEEKRELTRKGKGAEKLDSPTHVNSLLGRDSVGGRWKREGENKYEKRRVEEEKYVGRMMRRGMRGEREGRENDEEGEDEELMTSVKKVEY